MRTIERKKRNRRKLRDAEAANPPSKEYWTSACVCKLGRWYVKGRRRQRHKCYMIWVPPQDHPEWSREKVVIKRWLSK